jgi:hypothetical protein
MGLPRRRAVAILLFPVLAIIFIVGWIMYALGEPKASTKRSPSRNAKAAKKEHDLETGLLAELAEEQEVTAKH